MAIDDVPLVHDVENWPFKVVLPTLSILPVKHFTSHSDINEGGYLLAVDGVILPQVFVGMAKVDAPLSGPDAASSETAAGYEVLELFRAVADFDGGAIGYEDVEDIILDGWRPEDSP